MDDIINKYRLLFELNYIDSNNSITYLRENITSYKTLNVTYNTNIYGNATINNSLTCITINSNLISTGNIINNNINIQNITTQTVLSNFISNFNNITVSNDFKTKTVNLNNLTCLNLYLDNYKGYFYNDLNAEHFVVEEMLNCSHLTVLTTFSQDSVSTNIITVSNKLYSDVATIYTSFTILSSNITVGSIQCTNANYLNDILSTTINTKLFLNNQNVFSNNVSNLNSITTNFMTLNGIICNLLEYPDNLTAIANGIQLNSLYRTSDIVKVCLNNNTSNILLNGDDIIILYIGDTFIDPGATIINNINNYTISIIGSVSTNKVGSYIKYYNIINNYGNIIDSIKRTINVYTKDNITIIKPNVSDLINNNIIDVQVSGIYSIITYTILYENNIIIKETVLTNFKFNLNLLKLPNNYKLIIYIKKANNDILLSKSYDFLINTDINIASFNSFSIINTNINLLDNWTFETWVYPTNNTTMDIVLFKSSSNTIFSLKIVNLIPILTASGIDIGNNTININKWNHIAFVKNNTTIYSFVNGTRDSGTIIPNYLINIPTLVELNIGSSYQGNIAQPLLLAYCKYTNDFAPLWYYTNYHNNILFQLNYLTEITTNQIISPLNYTILNNNPILPTVILYSSTPYIMFINTNYIEYGLISKSYFNGNNLNSSIISVKDINGNELLINPIEPSTLSLLNILDITKEGTIAITYYTLDPLNNYFNTITRSIEIVTYNNYVCNYTNNLPNITFTNNLNSSWTIEFWFKLLNSPNSGSYSYIFDSDIFSIVLNSNQDIYLLINSTYTILLSSITINSCKHYAFCYNNNNLYIYINGTLTSTITIELVYSIINRISFGSTYLSTHITTCILNQPVLLNYLKYNSDFLPLWNLNRTNDITNTLYYIFNNIELISNTPLLNTNYDITDDIDIYPIITIESTVNINFGDIYIDPGVTVDSYPLQTGTIIPYITSIKNSNNLELLTAPINIQSQQTISVINTKLSSNFIITYRATANNGIYTEKLKFINVLNFVLVEPIEINFCNNYYFSIVSNTMNYVYPSIFTLEYFAYTGVEWEDKCIFSFSNGIPTAYSGLGYYYNTDNVPLLSITQVSSANRMFITYRFRKINISESIVTPLNYKNKYSFSEVCGIWHHYVIQKIANIVSNIETFYIWIDGYKCEPYILNYTDLHKNTIYPNTNISDHQYDRINWGKNRDIYNNGQKIKIIKMSNELVYPLNQNFTPPSLTTMSTLLVSSTILQVSHPGFSKDDTNNCDVINYNTEEYKFIANRAKIHFSLKKNNFDFWQCPEFTLQFFYYPADLSGIDTICIFSNIGNPGANFNEVSLTEPASLHHDHDYRTLSMVWDVYQNTFNITTFNFNSGEPNSQYPFNSTINKTYLLNKWHHFVLQKKNNILTCWINGIKGNTITIVNVTNNYDRLSFCVGAGGGNFPTKTKIKKIRIDSTLLYTDNFTPPLNTDPLNPITDDTLCQITKKYLAYDDTKQFNILRYIDLNIDENVYNDL